MITQLSAKEKKEASEFLLNYKFVYCCRICRRIYGSDFENESGICPICEIKLQEKKKK